MSHISKIKIKNFRGLKELTLDLGPEKFVIIIGRGDSGKSTILSAIHAVLCPSWNLALSDLDFYNQDTSKPIEIEAQLTDLPEDLIKFSKYGLYLGNELSEDDPSKFFITVRLLVDETLEPHWYVKARADANIEDKAISSHDRALFGVNYISDYTDNQFSYNRQSPLYGLTKLSMDNSVTIERVKSKILRSMSSNADEELLKPLNEPLDNLKAAASLLGLTLGSISANLDIKDNTYTGNSISLHNDDKPFRVQGKGTKRLMSIAIQTELAKLGGITLIDELEQGLEPDRIITLVRLLKTTHKGQVFITTHSAHVVVEAQWNNIFVLQNEGLAIRQIDDSLEACRRTQPHTFFAKKVICCEGKTECGYLRAIDSWLLKNMGLNMSSLGCVVVDSAGGNNMYTYAIKLKNLGYNTLIFADNDKPKELEQFKRQASCNGIEMLLCDENNCLEKQIFTDLPWQAINRFINMSHDELPSDKIIFSEDILQLLESSNEFKHKEVRERISVLSVKKGNEWFKNIPGGEFLGSLVMSSFQRDNSDTTTQNIVNLLTWLGIKCVTN